MAHADQIEPEIYHGRRGWSDTQVINASPDPAHPAENVTTTWYGTAVDENEGAFCMVAAGGPYEHLVGEYVQVGYGPHSVVVYCVGGSDEIASEFALARLAFAHLAPLWRDDVPALVQPLVVGSVG
jgi:hypothetical protein